MSIIRADSIKNRAGDGAPDFPNGITVTGIVTATTLNNVANNIDVDDFISVGNNIHLGNAGVCTATSFSGSGANLTSIPAGNLTGALPAISGANLTGISAGITVAQQFRLASNQAGSASAGTVLTNWEESDTDYQRIGSTVWTQSSGIFSCSATGIYLCHWCLVASNTSTGDAFDPNIQISVNSGGAYTTRSRSWAHVNSSTTPRDSPANSFMFDVTNTSTFRLRFRQSQSNDLASGTTIGGSTSENLTNIMFIRLGDT